MKIKIGEMLEHGGERFVVVDIRHEENMEGRVLYLRAYDPDMANKEQQRAIKVDQTSTQMIDMIKKITEGGGFDIGGMKFGG